MDALLSKGHGKAREDYITLAGLQAIAAVCSDHGRAQIE